MFRIFKSLYLISFLIPVYLTTNLGPAFGEKAMPELEEQLNAILKHKYLKDASIGLYVVSLKDKKTLFNYQADKLFKVASNMKLLTTAAGLYYLEADFEYKTIVALKGKILPTNGEFVGDIIIKGSGDPNISGRFYGNKITAVPEMWAEAIKKMGIKIIKGDIVADDSIFDREYINPTWPEAQLSRWYCAQICGLSFNDNCIDITLLPDGESGLPIKTVIQPDTNYIRMINSCKITDKRERHSCSLERKMGTNDIYLMGYFWKGAGIQKEWITVDNPALYLATVFKEILEKRGIIIKGRPRLVEGYDQDGINEGQEIIHTTSTIIETINIANRRSQNFYAEQLLKTLGAYVKGRGSISAGLDVIREMLTILGHRPDEYEIADGSGLSNKNRLTPKIITDLLCFMYNHKSSKIFIDSLAVSGVSGTLKKRLTWPPYTSKIKAKTGYIAGASALSGYAYTLGGEVLAFSILINDFKTNNRDIKILQDSICKILVNYHKNGSRLKDGVKESKN